MGLHQLKFLIWHVLYGNPLCQYPTSRFMVEFSCCWVCYNWWGIVGRLSHLWRIRSGFRMWVIVSLPVIWVRISIIPHHGHLNQKKKKKESTFLHGVRQLCLGAWKSLRKMQKIARNHAIICPHWLTFIYSKLSREWVQPPCRDVPLQQETRV